MPLEKDWSLIAADFDERQDYIVGKETTQIIKQHLSQLKNLGYMLELGCGNGKFTKQLANAASQIIATDISTEMVNVATHQLADYDHVKVEQADCYNTPYQDATFDTVFMANLIHVVLEPDKAIAEATRILKLNGCLVILSFTGDTMTPENLEKLRERYLEVLGDFPETKQPMGLSILEDLLETQPLHIESSQIIGTDTKAMFVVAHKTT